MVASCVGVTVALFPCGAALRHISRSAAAVRFVKEQVI
jgi:hypothetical protein